MPQPARAAYDFGRAGNLFTALGNQMQAHRSGYSIAPVLIFDQRVAYRFLHRLVRQIDQPLVEATLQIDGTNVSAVSGQTGRTFNIALTRRKAGTQRHGSYVQGCLTKIARLPKADQEVRQAPLSAFIDMEEQMTLNTRYLRTSLNATFLLIIFVSLLFNPIPSRALQNSELTLPDFTEFSKTVQNGEANVLRGVYVSGLLAFPIVQQPIDNANYVSSIDGELAQFGMAAQFGNVVLRHPSDDTFGRKLRKLNSILAGESSAKFSILLGDVAAFDCRISQLPQIEDVVDYFRWRSEDAHRNALNGHCYWMLRQQGESIEAATTYLAGLSVAEKN